MTIFNKWGPWTDLNTGLFEHRHYILQGRRSSTGKIELRVVSSKICYYSPALKLDDLLKLKFND